MNHLARLRRALAAAAFGLALSAAHAAQAQTVNQDIYILTNETPGQQRLFRFKRDAPSSLVLVGTVTGGNSAGCTGQFDSLDFRPLTGKLYSKRCQQLHTIDASTAQAIAVGTMPGTFEGTDSTVGFDFNPVADRIRLVSHADNNDTVNPDTAAVTPETDLAYAAGDAGAGTNPAIDAVAYSNNVAGATTTTLYGIDAARDVLVTIDPPASGAVRTVGPLVNTATGAAINTNFLNVFDIAADGTAFAIFSDSNANPADGAFTLYTIDLATGAATPAGDFNLIFPDSTVSHVSGLAVSTPGEVAAGQLIISEFRLRGPDGALDEFYELYNNTNLPVTVSNTDGSAGWAFVRHDPTANNEAALAVIPNGTVIPALSYFLIVNFDYSLDDYGFPDLLVENGSSAEAPVGLALFKSAVNFTAVNRLDSVGVGAITNPLYVEGTTIPAAPTSDAEYSFVRRLNSGTPRDTENNAADFLLVATDPAAVTGATAALGAPGPQNTDWPRQANSRLKASLIDPQCGGTATGQAAANLMFRNSPDGTPISGCQNRARDLAPQPANNSTSGTLFIRRRFTNTTSQPITSLRFRVVDITTCTVAPCTPGASAPAGQADLRVLSSGNVTYTTSTGATANVRGLVLEQAPPPAQMPDAPLGGGYNSSLLSESVSIFTPLAAGASIDVQFRLGVQQTGTFRFLVNIEADVPPPGTPAARRAETKRALSLKRVGARTRRN